MKNVGSKEEPCYVPCTMIPKYNFYCFSAERFPGVEHEDVRRDNSLSKAFVNDITSSFNHAPEEVTTEEENSQLHQTLKRRIPKKKKIKKMRKVKPRGHYCSVCRIDFKDYLRHINGRMHKENWRTCTSTFNL